MNQFVQLQELYLAGSGLGLSATSIALTEMKYPDGTNVTMSDFGSMGYAVLEPGTEREENISFTGITQNSDGSATLTGVTRGLKFKSPYDSDTNLRQSHAGGTTLVISNSAAFYNELLSRDNDETITGTYTFTDPNIPKMDSYSAPTADEQLASKKYVDDTASGGSVTVDGVRVEATAGESVSAGEVVYFDETDNEWKKADASVAGTSNNILLGISQGSGTDGNTISGGVLLNGVDENQSALNSGDRIYLSDTSGEITNSPGTIEVELGYVITGESTKIYFAPRFDKFLTENQQDAIAGTSGTPSSTNLFVTDDDTSDSGSGDKCVRGDGAGKIDDSWLQMTDANATTLTDGSDADSLHTHNEFSNVMGVKNNDDKTYHNFQINTANTSLWNPSAASVTYASGSLTIQDGSNNNHITTQDSAIMIGPDLTNQNPLAFDDNQDIIIEFWFKKSQATSEGCVGFTENSSPLKDYDDDTVDFIGFAYNGSDFYAKTSDGGVADTLEQISGFTITDWNLLRIEYDPGVDAKFYVNGTLEKTITTNLPSGTSDILFGMGTNGDGIVAITTPNINIEMP